MPQHVTTTMPRPKTFIEERTANALAARTVEHILEVLIGRRPLHQLRHRLSGPVAGLLATGLHRGSTRRPDYRLRSVHACQTTASKVEACAVVDTTERSRAFVFRLERKNTAWSCTMLSVL